jgi:hypothetical protein
VSDTKERYFIDSDNSSHKYIVPKSREAEWNAWQNLGEDDSRAWTAPDWAVPLGVPVSRVTFPDYEIE